jgi:hypothetical protein
VVSSQRREGSKTTETGERAAGEIRSSNTETRKKAEIRNPKRTLAILGTMCFRDQRLAGNRARGHPVPEAAGGLLVSAFGCRPSFGFRVSVFGF